MAATLVLQPAHNDRMQVHTFKGDQPHLLDKLIAASLRKEVQPETLKERTLVPFFDSEEASDTTFQPLQPSRRSPTKPAAVLPGKGGHGLKRHAHERSSPQLAGSPPNKEAELVKARHQRRGKQAASAGSGSDTDASTARKPRASGPANGRKHQLDGAPRSAAPGGGSAQRQSPQRKSPDHNADLDMVQLAAASAAAATSLRTPGKAPSLASLLPSKFAGPAFTNSPTPDCLPIPTSSLLLQEAADGLRSRLTL
jgi:hypothetical protein